MHARTSIAAILCALGLGACDSDSTFGTGNNPQVGNAVSGTGGGVTAAPATPGVAGQSGGPATVSPGSAGHGLGSAGVTGSSGSGGSAGASGTPAAMGGSAGLAADGGSGGAGVDVASSGAYFVSGRLHGYAWTSADGTDSTITPADFTALGASDPRCAKGSVGPSADYSGVAMLGVNLNQDQSTDAPTMTITPMAGGLSISITNNASSPLRLQIQAPDGGTNADDRWCAPLTGSGGFVPWSSFNTACWDGSGTAYANQPISAAMLLVPGGDMTAQAFDVCLNSLSEATAPSGGAGAGGTAAAGSGGGSAANGGGAGSAGGGSLPSGDETGTGTITDPYGVAMVTRDGKNYVIQNNVWGNNTSQSISYDGTTYTITQQTGMNAASGATAGAPVSYPSVFIGSNYNRTTAGSNLPKQVSALGKVMTGWSNNAGPAVSGIYNAAYDVWFSTSAAGDPEAPSGGYLMVWYYKPSGAQPIGNVMKMGITIAGVSGTWDVWEGPNNGKPVISYVRTQSINSLEYDLNLFIKDATDNQSVIQKSWYLSNVFAGFEIWSGGVGLETTSFYADVE